MRDNVRQLKDTNSHFNERKEQEENEEKNDIQHQSTIIHKIELLVRVKNYQKQKQEYVENPTEENYKSLKLEFDILTQLYKNKGRFKKMDTIGFEREIDFSDSSPQRKRSRTSNPSHFMAFDSSPNLHRGDSKSREITELNFRYEKIKGENIQVDDMCQMFKNNDSRQVSINLIKIFQYR